MIFGIVTRIDLLNFIKEHDWPEEGQDVTFRTRRTSSTTALTRKLAAMKTTTTANMMKLGNGDVAPMENGYVNGFANGEHSVSR